MTIDESCMKIRLRHTRLKYTFNEVDTNIELFYTFKRERR